MKQDYFQHSEGMRPPGTLEACAIIYLLLPVPIFLVAWTQAWLGLPACLALIYFAWRSLSPAFSQTSGLTGQQKFIAVFIASVWVALSAAGGFNHTHEFADWVKHDAIFMDLVNYSWPVYFRADPDNWQLFRYYLGFYLPPALAAKILGAGALNWAIPLWMGLGCALVMLMSIQGRSLKAAFIAAIVVIFFSGMDVLRIILFEDPSRLIPGDILLEWNWDDSMRVQYSANTTALYYVPQHFIAAALGSLLLIRCGYHRTFAPLFGLAFVAIPLWSAFVALGLLPLIVVAVAHQLRRGHWSELLTIGNVFTLLLLIPIAMYLLAGKLNFPQAWIWDIHSRSQLLLWMPAFLLLQFGILAIALLKADSALRRNLFLLVSIAVLSLLPFYSLGFYNDLAMRSSLPALFVLCYLCVGVLVAGSVSRNAKLTLSAILLIGSITTFFELAFSRKHADEDWHDYAKSERSVKQDTGSFLWNQYMVKSQKTNLGVFMQPPDQPESP